MTFIQENAFKNKKLLTGFIRQVRSFSDTPSLIQLIAADAGYLMLCRAVVNLSSQRNQELIESLKAVCRKQGLDFQGLQKKLIPAARALGLISSSNSQLDYYNLLGVSPLANASEIKRAFRKKAYDVHPDTGADEHRHSEKFVELNAAYQTLNEPVLRKHYDVSRQHLDRWHEIPMQVPKADQRGRALLVLQLVGLIIILVLVIIVFDFLFHGKDNSDSRHTYKPHQQPVPRGLLAMPSNGDHTDERSENNQKKIFTVQASTELDKNQLSTHEPELNVENLDSSSMVIHREQKQNEAVAVDLKTSTISTPETTGNIDKASSGKRTSGHRVSETKLEQPSVLPVKPAGPFYRRRRDKKDTVSAGFTGIDLFDQPVLNQPFSKSPGKTVAAESTLETSPASKFDEARLESQGVVRDQRSSSDLKKRLQNFLRTYCRTYEDKDLSKFTAFFTTDATENGKPFHGLLMKYRQNFESNDFITYRIKLQKFSYQLDTGLVAIEGNFFFEWRSHGEKWLKNSGEIFMELFEDSSSFRINRLDYYGKN